MYLTLYRFCASELVCILFCGAPILPYSALSCIGMFIAAGLCGAFSMWRLAVCSVAFAFQHLGLEFKAPDSAGGAGLWFIASRFWDASSVILKLRESRSRDGILLESSAEDVDCQGTLLVDCSWLSLGIFDRCCPRCTQNLLEWRRGLPWHGAATQEIAEFRKRSEVKAANLLDLVEDTARSLAGLRPEASIRPAEDTSNQGLPRHAPAPHR